VGGAIKMWDMDIKQRDDEVIVEINLPGIEEKDIILNVTNDFLEVKAKKEYKTEIKKKGFYKHEEKSSGYYRKISLPTEVKAEEAKTEFKNGVLKVRIPKAKQKFARKLQLKR